MVLLLPRQIKFPILCCADDNEIGGQVPVQVPQPGGGGDHGREELPPDHGGGRVLPGPARQIPEETHRDRGQPCQGQVCQDTQ